MTRFEYIKQMSLDELAEWMCDNNNDCNGCPGYDMCRWNFLEPVHANGLKKWLKENEEDEE